ncbi:UDP-N-acetylglucosamine transferase subunit ALG14 [Zalerion maritima]|uniref:UDP-N-acetylglucosamine transferase subunit ALG14 n=1 Tax=Zalerion maritima TaxID=339359 RepID=A0AAD5WYG9_9PEZI|nr:UDP-N-acetylglucosamine transferase subunit ALG14 [Zalerion maritima]
MDDGGGGFAAWRIVFALSLGAWGALSLVAPGKLSVLAGGYNLAKLATLSSLALRVLPRSIPILINVALATGIGAVVILLDGHLRVLRHKSNPDTLKAVQEGYRPDTTTIPINHCVFLLGSGGHTKEMCSMIRKQFPPSPNMHRRYIITSGDSYSAAVMNDLERSIKIDLTKKTNEDSPAKCGTYDCYLVERSRRVHQKWYSAVWSTLESTKPLFKALTGHPTYSHPGKKWPDAPNVVVTNGPGTGFVLCFLAHLMKVIYLAPQGSLKIVYVESLARVKTLSLTGKLFHWTNIADVFLVQHPGLAENYGKVYAGFMVDTTPAPS